MLKNLLFHNGQGFTQITPKTIQEFFELRGGVVHWRKSPGPKTPKGKEAGHLLRSTKYFEGMEEKDLYAGVKIGFKGHLLRAEEIAFTVHHERFPTGKLVHKDGDKRNNHPDNLIEIGA